MSGRYDGMKAWRCWSCREIIPPEGQAVALSYDSQQVSYYMCHCDADCTPKQETKPRGRKTVHPKINPRTMRYEEPREKP